ncbi:MAG: prepilin-type N-terminal cleavage/methylation domain-containing protein [Thermoguttaceae bacterium]
MPARRRQSDGISLIELLIVIAIMGVLVGMVIPKSDPGIHDQLRSAAQIVRTDLAYARSLAITNNSTYEVLFRTALNRYVLKHSGPNAALDTLPPSPFSNPGDPPDRHIVKLGELPNLGPGVELVAAGTLGNTPQSVGRVEFRPMGETTRSEETVIWLAAGRGKQQRYLLLRVNPVTGLAEVGDYTAEAPPATVMP